MIVFRRSVMIWTRIERERTRLSRDGGKTQMRVKRLINFSLLGVLLLSLGSSKTFGQATASAALEGTIADQSGAAVKGAKVAITSQEQGWTRSADTSDTGFTGSSCCLPGLTASRWVLP